MNAQISLFKGLSLALATTVSLSAAGAQAASSDNMMLLIANPDMNPVEITTSPENTLSLTITGEGNGGFGDVWPTDPIFANAPAPGVFSQTGEGHSLSLSIFGTNNLASVVQVGFGNTVSGYVSGLNNAAAVMQSGTGNYAAFQQVGTGNALAISQTSW